MTGVQTCALPISSPQELSNLITDPYTNEQVDRKFRNKPTSSAILRYYTFISHSIAQLEDELERHQQEREILYDNLFASQTFKYKIRPIVEEYRHHRAMRRMLRFSFFLRFIERFVSLCCFFICWTDTRVKV